MKHHRVAADVRKKSNVRGLPLAALGMALATLFARGAWAEEVVTSPSWLLMTSTPSSPTQELQDAIGRSGGTVVRIYPKIGILVVEASDPGFRRLASTRPDVSAVVPDVPLRVIEEAVTTGDAGGPALSPTDEPFFTFQWSLQAIPAQGAWGATVHPPSAVAQYAVASPPLALNPADEPLYPFQWSLQALHAKGAWDAGQRGAGARVIILSNSFDTSHPDLAPNLNLSLAKSFWPGEDVTPGPAVGFTHGTHAAGLIGATANGVGSVGVAPDVEMVPVRIQGDAGGLTLDSVLAGINYAIEIGGDVLCMPFVAQLPVAGFCDPTTGICYTADDIKAIDKAITKAIKAARHAGLTPIAAAGSAGSDLDENHSDFLFVPAETKGVLAISATGPVGWAMDQTTNLDVPETDPVSGLTNFGKKTIFAAAPGGLIGYPEEPICDIGLGSLPCPWFDKTISTSYPNPYFFGGGTFASAAHAAGVAALIIGKHGGHMSPNKVEEIMRQSADDLGPPGKDDYFGRGRLNAESAVQMTR